jgi:hypothetical protein
MSTRNPFGDTLANAVAIVVDDEGQIADALIGKMALIQIGNDLRITPERLAEYLDYFGIDSSYMPKPIDPRRVFLTVLNAHPKAPGRERSWLIGGRKYRLEFWAEEKQGGAIQGILRRQRRLEPEARKRLNSEWETTSVAHIVWAPETPEEVGPSVEDAYAEEYPYDEILAAVEADFRDQCSHYTGNTISSIVKKILNDTISLPVRQAGGAWVIPRDAISTLTRVEKLIDAIAAPPTDADGNPLPGTGGTSKTTFYQTDLIDGTKSRLIIRGALETKVLRELKVAIDQLRRVRRTGLPARPSELAEANQLRRKARSIEDHYAKLVSVDLPEVSKMLSDFDLLYEAAMTGAVEPPLGGHLDEGDDGDERDEGDEGNTRTGDEDEFRLFADDESEKG